MTYRFMAYDIITQLKKNFDDADITLNHAIYWIQVAVNKIKFQEIETPDRERGEYLSVFAPVTVQIDNDLKRRKFIDLPTQILDLNNLNGIEYITYNLETCCCAGPEFAQVRFWPTTPRNALRIHQDAYEKPKPDHPYFYRIGHKIGNLDVDRLYLMGLECIDVSDVEIGILSALNPADICNLDEEVPIAEHLVQQVMLEVLQIGRFMMLIPKDRINDGEDQTQAPQIQVPNIQAAEQEQQQQTRTQQ